VLPASRRIPDKGVSPATSVDLGIRPELGTAARDVTPARKCDSSDIEIRPNLCQSPLRLIG